MNISTRIQNLSGVTYAVSRTKGFWSQAARDTISLIISYKPALLERILRKVNFPTSGNLILGEESGVFYTVVNKGGYPAKKIQEHEFPFYIAEGDTNTLGTVFTYSEHFPIYYLSDNATDGTCSLQIKPNPTSGTDAWVNYIDYKGIDNLDINTDIAKVVHKYMFTAVTPVVGDSYTFSFNDSQGGSPIDHGLEAGDLVTINGWTTVGTFLNGMSAIVSSTGLTATQFQLEGVFADAVTDLTDDDGGYITKAGVNSLPTEFIHAVCLKTAMYELHWSLTDMKANIPATTGAEDWGKVKTFIETEEDVELATTKIQELSNEMQQWVIHYKWVESQYYTLEKEYKTLLLPMASDTKRDNEEQTQRQEKAGRY